MSIALLLDTDILVDCLRGHSAAREFLATWEQELFLSVVTVAELHAGIRNREERKIVTAFLSVFRVADVTREIAEHAGDLRARYGKSHGTGLADALIASTAIANGYQLATRNRKHYPMLKSLVTPYRGK